MIWYQVFPSNTNNLYTIIWFQVFLSNTNNLYTILWFQVFLSYTNNFSHRSIWPMNSAQTVTTSISQSGHGSNDNEEVFYTPRASELKVPHRIRFCAIPMTTHIFFAGEGLTPLQLRITYFPDRVISVLLNTVSVSLLFEHNTLCM